MPLRLEIARQPELWNTHKARLYPTSPHRETGDIWIRYKDEAEHLKSGDYSKFNDLHVPIWYPAFYSLPSSKKLIFDLMQRVEGEMLGGVLIYRVPAHKQIYEHVDEGWHANYFEKFNISIQSNQGCEFIYPRDEEAMSSNTGDAYWFRNTVPHRVQNHSDEDQIMMTVCIRTHKG